MNPRARALAELERPLAELLDPLPVPAGGQVRGRLVPPGSKSFSHRALNLAWLSGTRTEIDNLLVAEDTALFLHALDACGVTVRRGPRQIVVKPAAAGAVVGEPREVWCGNAGTMFRFVVATLCTMPGRFRVDGTPRLRERPVGPLVAALRQLGAEIEWLGTAGGAPLLITGGTLRGGRCRLDASASSQYLSALLMASTRAREPVTIEVESLVSAPYVDVTLAAMAAFGVADRVVERADTGASTAGRFRVVPGWPERTATQVRVEGDYSAAAYPAAAAAITGGEVELEGLDPHSVQGDRGFLDLLTAVGAEVEWRNGLLIVRASGELRGIRAELAAMPDQVPTLAAVAAFCEGETRIENVGHLRIKESDRLRAMALEMARAGVDVRELSDGLEIRGRPEWRAATAAEIWRAASDRGPAASVPVIDSHDDHRIAMSLALVGLRRPLAIARPAVVAKSYPGFWRDLAELLSRAG